MVAHFPSFPGKNGKCAKEETAARSFRPKICRPSADGMKLAPFGRSDSHSVRALRAVKSCPCGAGLHSNGRGSWTSSCLYAFRRCGHMHISTGFDSLCADTDAMLTVKYAGADPHTSRCFSACPWKICVAAFASPLFVTFILMKMQAHILRDSFCPNATEFFRFLSVFKEFLLIGRGAPFPHSAAPLPVLLRLAAFYIFLPPFFVTSPHTARFPCPG